MMVKTVKSAFVVGKRQWAGKFC